MISPFFCVLAFFSLRAFCLSSAYVVTFAVLLIFLFVCRLAAAGPPLRPRYVGMLLRCYGGMSFQFLLLVRLHAFLSNVSARSCVVRHGELLIGRGPCFLSGCCTGAAYFPLSSFLTFSDEFHVFVCACICLLYILCVCLELSFVQWVRRFLPRCAFFC